MKNFIYYILLLTFSFHTLAYETDNITDRDKIYKLNDAGPELDLEVNRRLKEAITITNKKVSCNEDIKAYDEQEMPQIFKVTRRLLDTNPVAEIEDYAWEDESISRYKPEDSVYEKSGGLFSAITSLWESRVMAVAGTQPSIKLYGTIIGVDKTGHFMAQGYEYFEGIKTYGDSVMSSLKSGENMEDTYYGLQATGIKSYGDMGANFSGMQFWNNLLDSDNPYLKCNENGKYELLREFSWKEYINDSWDEGVNCSDFKESIEKNVKSNLKKYGYDRCPVDTARCFEIAKLPCARHYINEKCLSLAIEVNEYCPEDITLIHQASLTPSSDNIKCEKTVETIHKTEVKTLKENVNAVIKTYNK